MAELVVPAALILIGEHLVGLVDLLKFRLGVSVTGVEIGMILLRLLTVCFFISSSVAFLLTPSTS